ncbi:MAG: stress responsive protein [Devosia sp.]|nr:stress responsive protein [Devosia sp.]
MRVDACVNREDKTACFGSQTLIRHIVFFTAKTSDNLDAICEGLMLLGTIPHSRHFEVTRNSKVDQISNEIDVVVYAEFENAAALAAYKAHPTYAEATERVRPLRELRFSADVKAQG